MAEDIVEIIEISPEIIEISDEEDEENRDTIVISYDSADLKDDNITTIKEESIENDNLPSPEAQPNPSRNNEKRPALRKAGGKKRKKPNRPKEKTSSNGVTAVQIPKRPTGIKIPRRDSLVIKEENSTANTETIQSNNPSDTALQNEWQHLYLDTDELTASSSVNVSRTANSPSLSTSYDFSKISWLKPLSNLSSPPHLQLVIIDRNHPDWKIETDKWLMIEKRLLEALHTEMLRSNDSSIGLFDGAKWQRGIKIVGCQNKKALNFIKNFILKLDKLWVGAKLDVCTMSHFERLICRVFIPPPILKTETVLSLIKLQNPMICSEDWKVLGERERNRGIDLWLSINGESISYLRRSRGEVKYGINRVFLKPVI